MFHAETRKLDTTHKTPRKHCIFRIGKLVLAVASSFFASMNMQSGAWLHTTQGREKCKRINLAHVMSFVKLKGNCGHSVAVDVFERHIYTRYPTCQYLEWWKRKYQNTILSSIAAEKKRGPNPSMEYAHLHHPHNKVKPLFFSFFGEMDTHQNRQFSKSLSLTVRKYRK